MNRLQEILKRKQEIRSMLEGDQEVDVKEIEKELRELQDEEQKIIEKRKLAESINTGEQEHREIPKPKEQRENKPAELRNLKWNEAVEREEYRTAWAKDMMGFALSNEEREFMNRINDEYRAFTHTTENTAILVPKTVTDGIWKRADELSSLWADVRKLRVRGELTMIKGSNSADGRWYDEADTVDTDQLAFGELNLKGNELAKAIQVSWKLKKMAVAEFESYIIQEIGDRMGAALGKGVYEGKGQPGATDTFKAEPLGIKTALAAVTETPQIVEYTDAPTYVDFTKTLSTLHSSYANGATIYANSKTIWNQLANIKDGTQRPYFMPDVQSGGVGRIFGLLVKADASIPEGEVLVGNLSKGYVANINEDITMYREEHVRERLTDYMGYAIVDGAPLDHAAFVILQAGTPTV